MKTCICGAPTLYPMCEKCYKLMLEKRRPKSPNRCPCGKYTRARAKHNCHYCAADGTIIKKELTDAQKATRKANCAKASAIRSQQVKERMKNK